MTKDEFGIQMDRMIDCYGERAYPKDRIDQVWEWSKKIPDSLFHKIITKLICDFPNHKPPIFTDFQTTYTFLRRRHSTYYQQPPCVRCDGRGIIMALFRSDPTNWELSEDFACDVCELGKAKKELRFWQEHHKEKFMPRWELNTANLVGAMHMIKVERGEDEHTK